jgi:hypothetical protein
MSLVWIAKIAPLIDKAVPGVHGSGRNRRCARRVGRAITLAEAVVL